MPFILEAAFEGLEIVGAKGDMSALDRVDRLRKLTSKSFSARRR